ncbi:hypothetical protein AAOE16_03065 [Ekhidna sp. MALMAid0563]|uniref:hypothetical protein n=1 Tax=Ekhidna sp. MALMAid0563 TaxID=3143937 RepID=UPI0032DE41D5
MKILIKDHERVLDTLHVDSQYRYYDFTCPKCGEEHTLLFAYEKKQMCGGGIKHNRIAYKTCSVMFELLD